MDYSSSRSQGDSRGQVDGYPGSRDRESRYDSRRGGSNRFDGPSGGGGVFGGGGFGGRGGGAGGYGNRERKRSASPKRPRGPTPDLTNVVPIDVRKRRLTMWDLKPTGYENVTAEQAKMSGTTFL
jgi:splicing factor U2AF 65 kDa subunit